jgi:hypothetical protein
MADFLLQMPCDESNFVWTSHKLVVEMKENMMWFWNAVVEAHGTTHSALSMRKENWKLYARDYPDHGQWTRVMTIPQAVATSVKRQARLDVVELDSVKRIRSNDSGLFPVGM